MPPATLNQNEEDEKLPPILERKKKRSFIVNNIVFEETKSKGKIKKRSTLRETKKSTISNYAKLISEIKDSKISFYSTDLLHKSSKVNRIQASQEIKPKYIRKNSENIKMAEQSFNNIRSVPKLKRPTYTKITRDQWYFNRSSKTFRAISKNSFEINKSEEGSI